MREDKFIEREKTKTRVRWFCSLLLLFLCLFDSLRLNLGHSVWLLKNRVRFCNVLFLHSVRKQEQQRKQCHEEQWSILCTPPLTLHCTW